MHHRQEGQFDSAPPSSLNCTPRSSVNSERIPSHGWMSSKCVSSSVNDSSISAESRRLQPSLTPIPILSRARPRICNSYPFTSVGALTKVYPAYAFDPARKKGKQSPPGVEFASELLLKATGRAKSSQSFRENKNMQVCSTFSRSGVRNNASSSEDYRNYAFAAAVGVDDGLTLPSVRPQMTRSYGKQSQTWLWCFVPASLKMKERHDSSIAAQSARRRSTRPEISFDKTQAYGRSRNVVVPEVSVHTD